jgi:hypothetical protein
MANDKYSKPDQEMLDKLSSMSPKELGDLYDNADRLSALWLKDAIILERELRLSEGHLNVQNFIKYLGQEAKNRNICRYGDLTDLLGVEWNQARRKIFRILGEVLDEVHSAGQPLLCVIVVDSQTGSCGAGFFKKARELGYEFDDEAAFEREQRQKVFDYWAANLRA